MQIVFGILVGVVGLFWSAGQNAQNPPFVLPDSVNMLRDVAYGPVGNGLAMDLFLSRSGQSRPAVVFVSCGGWIGGSKTQFWRQAAYLASQGIVGAATQCRPAPAARFPDQLNDAIAAIVWLRAHAAQYGVDVNRMSIAGASSGGHLAALIGLNRWSGSNWSGAPASARVRAAIVFNGVFDLTALETSPVVAKNAATFLGVTKEQDPSLWSLASPLHHVTASAAPFLLLHGTNDVVVPFRQSTAMQRRLHDEGVTARLITADNSGHGFFNQPPWFEQSLAAMAEFLKDRFQ